MIEGLRIYPKYKASEVPWLSQIPAHWHIKPLKRWVTINASTLSENTDPAFAFRYIDIGSVKTGRLVSKPEQLRFGKAPSRAKRILRRGDTIVSTVRTYLKTVWFVGEEADNLIASTGFAVLTPGNEVEPAYLGYVIQSEPFVDQVSANSIGIAYPAISETVLGRLSIPLPPTRCEQTAIVRFLDHANRRIERFIRAKRKLIALLNEQKQGIIYRAITGGVDHDVRMKPSGVAWLGDVPEHWSIQRTKNVFRLRTQKSGKRHGLELLSIYTHIGVRPRKELEERGNKATTTDDYWLVRKGDIVVNKLLAWMGAVGVSDYEGVTSPAYDILMPIREVVPEFYHHLFRTRLYLQLFKQRSRGIMDMRLRLYFDQLGQIPILVPPVEEQSTIVALFKVATTDLDKTIGIAQREIALLHEYRTRLIADVVTGQLDVREAAAQLPEESALDTTEDDSDLSDETEPADDEALV
jgi:type I restriction enzyme S subunit